MLQWEKYHGGVYENSNIQNIDMEYEVSTDGLDTLNASASGQFSEQQFRLLADTLREVAGDKQMDAFIEFTKTVDLDNTWFHFHCHAGSGRTGTFMMLYDKMKNPQISEKDIFYRQFRMGSNYPLYPGSEDSYKYPLYGGKAEMAPLLMQYVEENYSDNYATSWSDWLEQNKKD